MKKTLLILALGSVLLTSCDPLKAEGDFIDNNVTSETIIGRGTFAQYDGAKDENGEMVYTPSEDGNYIDFSFPDLTAVTCYYVNKKGEKKILSYGRNAARVYYMPPRGSESEQTIYFSCMGVDGNEVVAEKVFTLKVAQALTPEMKVLVSNAGTKKWKWMPTSVNGGAVWGNGGYLAGEQSGGQDINGAWWGCGVEDGECADKFSGQSQHAGSNYDKVKDECYALSYMEFNEEGGLIAYSPSGDVINEGGFSISGWKNNEIVNSETFSRGTLETTEGAILWPFAINTGGQMPTEFNIGYLDVDRMVLLYSVTGEAWSECTWWSFMSDSDAGGVVASHEWHWKPTNVNGGAVWGNGGYGAGSQNGLGDINGAWWGCGTEDGPCGDKFSTQMGHAGAVFDEGEIWNASKMVFNEDEETITVYGKDGNQIRQGSFSFDMTPNPDVYSLGTLNTSEGAILWPFAINQNGLQPTKFDIGYLGTDAMILLYSPSGNAWEECTWWSFGK